VTGLAGIQLTYVGQILLFLKKKKQKGFWTGASRAVRAAGVLEGRGHWV
jgi:hypothetical protein